MRTVGRDKSLRMEAPLYIDIPLFSQALVSEVSFWLLKTWNHTPQISEVRDVGWMGI